MPTTPDRAARSIPALPPTPSVTDVLASLRVRLDTLTRHVLPALGTERELLVCLWYSDDVDAHVIHTGTGVAIPCDPAGADRLSTILAKEEALRHEADALRDVTDALETYAAGGRHTLNLLHDATDGTPWSGDAVLLAAPGDFADPDSVAGQEQTRWLGAYLESIDGDIVRAVASGDHGAVHSLTTERTVVHGRLARRRRAMAVRSVIHASRHRHAERSLAIAFAKSA